MPPAIPPRLAPWLLLTLCVALAAWAGHYRPRPVTTTYNAVVSLLGSGARNTVMADLDGDGRLDLAVAANALAALGGDTSVVIWLANKNGTLRRHARLPGLQANLLAGADLDQDGDVDLLAGYWEDDHLVVLLNDGHAHYHAAGRVPAPPPRSYALRNLVLGDMNNDGVPDLVLKGDSCSITVGYNDGHAHFKLKTEELSPLFPEEKNTESQPHADRHGYCPFEVALADVDRDGDLDIVTLNEGFHPTTLSIMYNDGAHGKLESEELVWADDYMANLTIGDVNGDGWPDMVMSGISGNRETPNLVFMLLNDGHGGYSSNITMGGLDNGPQDEFAGPTRARRLSTDSLEAWRVALGDVDHDHDLDLIVGSHWGEVGVRRNDGRATFGPLYRVPVAQGYQAELPVADFDGDGRLEVLRPYPALAGPRRPVPRAPAVLDKLR